jgi:hypothetical protein
MREQGHLEILVGENRQRHSPDGLKVELLLPVG